MMKISGSLLSKARIGAMLDSETVREATGAEYRDPRACVKLYLEFRHMVEFDTQIPRSKNIFQRFTEFSPVERQRDIAERIPVPRKEMEYNPPHPSKIAGLMKSSLSGDRFRRQDHQDRWRVRYGHMI